MIVEYLRGGAPCPGHLSDRSITRRAVRIRHRGDLSAIEMEDVLDVFNTHHPGADHAVANNTVD